MSDALFLVTGPSTESTLRLDVADRDAISRRKGYNSFQISDLKIDTKKSSHGVKRRIEHEIGRM